MWQNTVGIRQKKNKFRNGTSWKEVFIQKFLFSYHVPIWPPFGLVPAPTGVSFLQNDAALATTGCRRPCVARGVVSNSVAVPVGVLVGVSTGDGKK